MVDRALEWRVCDELDKAGEGDVDVDFGPPSRDRDLGGSGRPTVSLYLYDVREDLDRRQNGTVVHHDDLRRRPDGTLVRIKSYEHDPPRYAQLSYLLTTWATDVASSHLMLGVLLVGLARNRILPLRLHPDLEVLDLSAMMDVGGPMPGGQGIGDLWGGLDHVVVPSLNVTVSLPLLTFLPLKGLDHLVRHPPDVRLRTKRLQERAPRAEAERSATGE
ncbi:Pvc16 family protein [Streptomyces cinnamoneus]|nr:Pvc16 family protein [Streptomyces cinnamoneus]